MDTRPTAVSESSASVLAGFWHNVRGQILGGLLFVLPILITVWIIYWLYTTLEKYVIDAFALLVLWLVQGGRPDTELPFWFEMYAAPVIAIILALVLLYGLGFLVRSRVRRGIDWVLLRVPLISIVYNGVRNVFQSLERQRGQQRLQRAVLVTFPHPGMKATSFRDRHFSRHAHPKSPFVRVRPDIAHAGLRVLAAGPRRRGDGTELDSGANPASDPVAWSHGSPGGTLLFGPACYTLERMSTWSVLNQGVPMNGWKRNLEKAIVGR
jgi:uncharacterized membrane protein